MKAIVVILLCFILTSAPAQPVKEYGQLKVQGTQLVSHDGQPVVLRGMSFGWHNFWPRFYNENAVKWLHSDWKCTVVRAAMGVEPDSGYIRQPEHALARIRAVVDGAIAEGLYVIVDWHSHNIRTREARQFFADMAKQYGGYPNVIWEIFNEPDYETWPQVKAYSEEIIKTIRAIDPDNIILVGSPRWDQSLELPAGDPITGYQNLMYTMHFYAATHTQELREKTEKAISDGLPIFVSECAGMEATGDGPINYEEWQKWIDWMEKFKLSWITWSVSDKDETCSVLKKSAASGGNWSQADLKESGIRIREYLRKLNANEK